VKDAQSFVNIAILHASVDQASIGHVVWCQADLRHLVERVERVVQLVALSITLDQYAVCHCGRSDSFDAHLMEHCNSPVHVSEANTSINQTVVENLIWFHLRLLLHLLQEHESLVKVSCAEVAIITFETLDESGVREVIGQDVSDLHLLKEAPSLLHLVAAHTNVDHRVIGDVVGLERSLFHESKELEGLVEPLLLSTTLDDRVEGNLVELDEGLTSQTLLLHLIEELERQLKLSAVYARVHQHVEQDLVRPQNFRCGLVFVEGRAIKR